MGRELRRRTPEECMLEVQAEEEALTHKGHLKIFLGYSSGVGKTFRMLDEARRRKERGQDIVVGAIQQKRTPDIDTLLKSLEVIPSLPFEGGNALDVDAIVRRHPAVCIVDGLAYDNPPSARNPTRWLDVHEIQKAGIKVITSINIQYVDEYRERVEEVTGKHVEVTVPVAFIKSADEIEIVDAPPVEHLERSAEDQLAADEREERLSKLREMTLVLAADVVDHQLNHYLERHGIHQHFGAQERILICITPRANVPPMLEAAQIVVERFHAELIVAYVRQPAISAEDQAALDERLVLARGAGARIEILESEDAAGALLTFARTKGVTQLFVGHSQRHGMARIWGGPVDRLIWNGHGMDVRVFPQ